MDEIAEKGYTAHYKYKNNSDAEEHGLEILGFEPIERSVREC